jgi:hypothetical protein
MKQIRKITKFIVLLALFFSFNVGSVRSAEKDYEPGDLIKIEGVKGAAVYEIGDDGKKYVYPDQKTYETWHNDFSDVKAVSTEEIDKFEDGGIITVQPGSTLITHENTNKVYAVADDGKLLHVPSEAKAEELFGKDWSKNVKDVDPGIFATSYTDTQQEISASNIPSGSLVNEDGSEEYYLIKDNVKRSVRTYAYGKNNLEKKIVTTVKVIPAKYNLGEPVKVEEEEITKFKPKDERNEQVVICHKPLGNNASSTSDVATKPQTIKISKNALEAHLAHGDVLGACPNDSEPEPEVSCSNVVVDIKPPAGGTYWQSLGLDTSGQTHITRYRIQWPTGYWSPWYTKGVDDIDWENPTRRVWAYFDDHTYQIEWCQKINDDLSDISCPGGAQPILEEKPAEYNIYWENLGLNIPSTTPAIQKYKIKWYSGAWTPQWYYPGVNDLDWKLNTRRVWSYFDDHPYKIVYCPNS